MRTGLYTRWRPRKSPAHGDRIPSMPARALWAASLVFAAAALGKESAPLVVVGRIDTPIHPAAANYLSSLLSHAEKEGASLVVLTLSTPGGLLASTREMSS